MLRSLTSRSISAVRKASFASKQLSKSDNPFSMERPVNVLGQPLQQCGTSPMTGFYRDGYCNTGPGDNGSHTLAAVVSKSWLDFSASKGNDLRPILSDGCSWCLCVSLWKQSLDAFRRGEIGREAVPMVKLDATHQRALDVVTVEDLREFATNASPTGPEAGGPIR